MKGKFAVVGTALLLALLACGSPFDGVKRNDNGPGRLTVRIGTGARTVVHDFSADIDSVDITLTSKSGYETKVGTIVLPGTSHTFESVEAGIWDIRITAKKAVTVLGTGVLLDRSIVSGTTTDLTIPVIFPTGDGTGDLSLKIRFPSNLGIDYVEGTINETTDTLKLTDLGGECEASFDVVGLPAGYGQDLRLTFKRGGNSGTAAGMFLEAVNIWSGLTSDRWIDANGQLSEVRTFAANEFFEANSSLSDLKFSARTIDFEPGLLTYDLGTLPASPITLTATGAVAGQYIQYRVNGSSWIGVASGTASAAFALTVGVNTVEVLVTAPDQSSATTYIANVTGRPTIYIFNHTNFDPVSIPDEDIEKAALMSVYFEHASVGGNIFSDETGNGFDTLRALNSRYSSLRVHWVTADYPTIPPDPTWFTSSGGLADLYRGNPGEVEKLAYFRNSMLNTDLASHVDVATFKFCYIDYPNSGETFFNETKAELESLEAKFPSITFVWWTMPIEPYYFNPTRQDFNIRVRDYCATNNKWLLDIADLESHDEAGTPVLANGTQEMMWIGYSKESDGHLNTAGAVKVAKAYWRLICEISGTRQP